MRVEDFFRDPVGGTAPYPDLDVDLLREVRRSPGVVAPDAEAALALVQLARREFTAYGTDGGHAVTEVGSREILRTLLAITRRIGITDFDPPFSDFGSFRTYWNQNDGYGNWQARRDMITRFFEPLQIQLELREDEALGGELAKPITLARALGWPDVDAEMKELRRHFHAARTVQDYRNIGNDCVAVLEALSATVYNPELHLRTGEVEPPVANTKQRLERYADVALPGPGNAELRGLVKKTIEFAQAVKHNPDGSRQRAGIGADAVIQLSNILRRLVDGP